MVVEKLRCGSTVKGSNPKVASQRDILYTFMSGTVIIMFDL